MLVKTCWTAQVRSTSFVAATVGLAAAATVAGADPRLPGAATDGTSRGTTAVSSPGRYTMTPTDGGMLRLDTATGAVSFCTRTSGEWSCAPTKDGEDQLKEKVRSLEAEIASLKDRLRAMDEIAGIGDPDQETPRAAKPTLPTEKDVEQAFDYLERMMKTLRERMRRLEGNEGRGTPL